MIELDLHGMAAGEGLEALVNSYNRLVDSGESELLVVHGYGSSGVGGVLQRKVRSFLRSAGVQFFTESESRCNIGQTLVKVGKSPISVGDGLDAKMLKFCAVPKTKEKLFSKFHKSGRSALQQTFSALLSKGLLHEKRKGKYKVYEAK